MTYTTQISKTALLQATNQGLNFYSFVIPQLIKTKKDICENTYNPFYEDKNPSFSIYFSEKKEQWMFKDHGGSPDGTEYAGDVFEFAKLHYETEGLSLRFGALLRKMVEDLGIDPKTVESKVEIVTQRYSLNRDEENTTHFARSIGFDILSKEYVGCIDDAHTYFSQYGVTKEVLLRYNVKAVKRYLYIDKEGLLQARDCRDTLVIAYEDAFFSKMYKPHPKSFWYLGKKPRDYMFGFNQIVNRNRRSGYDQQETLIITGGEKDVLTLTSLGYDAVCFNSETASIPQLVTDILFHWYKRIIVMYDNDITGKAQTREIVAKLKADFNVIGFKWQSNLQHVGGKDVSDYIRLGLDIEALREQIASCKPEDESNSKGQVTEELITTLEIPANDTYTPFIPEEVYRNLPDFFKQLCDQFPDQTDKDLLLLSALTVASSLFPTVSGEYGRAKIGANLYLFVSGPSAAGKGVMQWSRKLGTQIQEFLKQKFINEMMNYEAGLAEYNSGGNPDTPRPIRPLQQTMFIPANCSISKIIQFLSANRNFGIIMETEADTLAAAFKNDWGNFSDVLRKAFHHETVSLARKANDEFIEIERPQLSVVLSGTFNQVSNLLDSVENGLFSRFLFYEFRSGQKWKNQFSQQKNNGLDTLLIEAGKQMLSWWEMQLAMKESIVNLQPHHEDILNRYFENKLQQLGGEYGEPIEASIKRACLMCYRLAIILSIVRVLDCEPWLPTSIFVKDADFECALRIVDTLLYHLQKVYSRLESADKTSKLKVQPRALYDALPEDFTRQQFDGIAEKLKIKYKTAERYLNVLFKEELVQRYEQGKYRKL